MEIKIEGEAVNKMVADAILKSAIGEAVKAAIEKELKNLSKAYDNPLEAVIRNHISNQVRELLITEYSAQIKVSIQEKLALELTDEFIYSMAEKAADRYS